MNILSLKKLGFLLILMGIGLIAKAEWVINDNEVSDGNWSFVYEITDEKIKLTNYKSGADVLDLSSICKDTDTSGLILGDSLLYGNQTITTVVFPSEPIQVSRRAFRESSLSGDLASDSPIELLSNDPFAITQITSVSFPNIYGKIPVWSFHGCSNLTSVVLSKDITSISGTAFSDCVQLQSFSPTEFPEVTHIEGAPFKNCKKLQVARFSFPKVESIPGECFHSLQIKELYLPMCSSIGGSAFYNSSATNITLGPVVTNIGSYAFGVAKVENLGTTKYSIPTIPSGLFNQAKSLKGVLDFSKSTFTSIPGEVFCQMPALERLILPETLSSLTRNSITKLDKCEIVFLGAKPSYDTNEIFWPSSNNFKNRLSFVITEKHINSWTNAVNDIVFTPLKDVPDSEKTDTYYFPKSDESRVIGLISTTSLKYDIPVTSWLSVLNEVGTIIVIR